MNTKKLYNIELPEASEDALNDYIKEVVGLIVNYLPLMSSDLVNACKNGNWQQVYYYAHKMKPTIDLLNITDIKDVIRTIETQSKHAINTEELPSLINNVNEVVTECTEQLRKDFSL